VHGDDVGNVALAHPVHGEAHVLARRGRETQVEAAQHGVHRAGPADLARLVDGVEHARVRAPGEDDEAPVLDVDDEPLLVEDLVEAVAAVRVDLVEARSVGFGRRDRPSKGTRRGMKPVVNMPQPRSKAPELSTGRPPRRSMSLMVKVWL